MSPEGSDLTFVDAQRSQTLLLTSPNAATVAAMPTRASLSYCTTYSNGLYLPSQSKCELGGPRYFSLLTSPRRPPLTVLGCLTSAPHGHQRAAPNMASPFPDKNSLPPTSRSCQPHCRCFTPIVPQNPRAARARHTHQPRRERRVIQILPQALPEQPR